MSKQAKVGNQRITNQPDGYFRNYGQDECILSVHYEGGCSMVENTTGSDRGENGDGSIKSQESEIQGRIICFKSHIRQVGGAEFPIPVPVIAQAGSVAFVFLMWNFPI